MYRTASSNVILKSAGLNWLSRDSRRIGRTSFIYCLVLQHQPSGALSAGTNVLAKAGVSVFVLAIVASSDQYLYASGRYDDRRSQFRIMKRRSSRLGAPEQELPR